MSKMKVRISFYNTYGKHSGDELNYDSYVEDTRENRKQAVDEFVDKDGCYDDIEKFLNGKTNTISFSIYGGDWDDPTGGYIIITTYEQELEKLTKAIELLNKKFGAQKINKENNDD